MGILLETFSNLNDLLLAECRQGGQPVVPGKALMRECDVLVARALRPLLPPRVRLASGLVTDLHDRQAGPFDCFASADTHPVFGEGMASVGLADGVVFCLRVGRVLREGEWREAAALGQSLKALELDKRDPILWGAVGLETDSYDNAKAFMASSEGATLDVLFSLGQYVVIRNGDGVYGDPQKVPFVSERGGAASLKSFLLHLIQKTHAVLNLPFGLERYQHL